ncbi:hypothetical protein psyc5s11_30480 [Clostridium gelidum]|uniref:RES domain-containing protein n=1 Tax=Clostridium gelidum TaxID=704125 RepID=A0ABN6J1X2_9CLOT|nr:RES domain-containing protein [Clostridium gelidum]BCZ46981.1 hypothetical protein psyc5s11_30480 [Clostridium gelidum]
MNCCEKCFNNKDIIKFIKSNKTKGKCAFCNSTKVYICSTDNVGSFIREGFNRAYEHLEGLTGAMWDCDEHEYIGKDGDDAGRSLHEILFWTEQIFSEKYDADTVKILLETLMESSGPSMREIRQGEIDYLSDVYDACFVLKNDLYGEESTNEHIAWEIFKYKCKYYNRYFDVSKNQSSRKKLLNQLKNIFKHMKCYLDLETTLYRSRPYEIIELEQFNKIDFYREVAPAPAALSINNRMSPKGISYTYLADNIKTSIQEIRLESGQHCIIGEFHPRKKINILDLSVSPKFTYRSIFSKKYNHDLNWIEEFINSFANEISKPISEKDKEIEYIATQILAEYIRMLGYEGIKYESSLIKGTYNYALFCGPNTELCSEMYSYQYNQYIGEELVYFTDWLKLDSFSYQRFDGMKLDMVKYINNINDIKDKSLIPNGIYASETFYNVSEIKNRLNELSEYIKLNYDAYIDNSIAKDFSLEDSVIKIVNDYDNSKYRGSYSIDVTKGFHYLDVYLCVEEMQKNTKFYFRHKQEDEMWNKLLVTKIN